MGYFSGQKSKFVGRVEVTKPDRNPQLLGFTSFNPTYAKRSTKINRLYPNSLASSILIITSSKVSP